MSTRRRLAVSLVAAAAAAGAVPLFVGSPASSAPAPAQCPSVPSDQYTMVTPVGPPAAVDLGDIGVEGGSTSGYAALGGDKKLYYQAHDYSQDPLAVTDLACLGGQATDAPAVITDSDGGLVFFVRAANGRIYWRQTGSTAPSTGDPDYSSIGSFTPITNVNFTGGVGAIQTPDGQYHVFGRGTNGALYHAFLQANGTWRVENLGGSVLGQPSVVLDNGKVLIAVTTPSGAIYTKRGSNFAWGPYIKVLAGRTVNGPALTTKTSPALVTNDSEEGTSVTLYAVGANQGLYRLNKAPGVAFPSTPFERVDTVLPADARIAAVETGDVTPTLGAGTAIVYATWKDKTTNTAVAAYTQFYAGSWHDYRLVPYSCFNCAPVAGVSTTETKSRTFKAESDGKVALDSQKAPAKKTK